MFAIAALLVSGATVRKATVAQALIGTVLFHTLFVVSPLAGKALAGDAQIGEYFRSFVAYAVITTALVLRSGVPLDDSFEGFRYRDLLTHTSGLKAWLPLYAFRDSKLEMRDSYLRAILQQGPEYEPHSRVVYSDLNFILLWLSLPDYLERAAEILPGGAMFLPPAARKPGIAATEWGQRWEQKMCADRKIEFDGFRQGLIWGETHDGNSHYAGGTAGNAGLFATARAVYRMTQGWLDGTLVTRGMLAEATRNYTTGLEENRGLGWLLSDRDHPATGMLSPRAFGHTGFTGTSLFVDPERDRIMVLLTNRVHPCAAPVAMQKIRGEFHRLALAT
jgi:CubicO group peptidase (beta-lactamase class C family)